MRRRDCDTDRSRHMWISRQENNKIEKTETEITNMCVFDARLSGQEDEVTKCYNSIEDGLTLVGCTGIDDRQGGRRL